MKSLPINKLIIEKISGEWGSDISDPSNSGVVVIRTANFLNSGKIDFSKIVRRDIESNKVNKKKLISGDIIIEKSGGSPSQPVGRVVLFENPDGDTYLCNNFTTILRPDRKLIYPKYFFYALFDNHKKGKTLRYQNKTTGIINLKLDNYLNSEIPLPSLDDQKRIAHLLGKAEGLIAQRKQHLQQLDDLLKSVFLGMFGDPVRNEKGWKAIPLSSLGEWRSGGTPSRNNPDYYIGNIPWVSSGELNEIYISGSAEKICQEAIYQSAAKIIEPYSLLLGMYDTAALKSSINTIRMSCNQAIAYSKLDERKCNVIFVYWYIQIGKDYFKSKQRGVRQKNLNLAMVKSIPVFEVPITFQNQFAAIVEKVESIKSRYKQSLADLETLYGALSQKAFKGELDLSRVPLPEEDAGVMKSEPRWNLGSDHEQLLMVAEELKN